MLKHYQNNANKTLLFLDTRELPCERQAEIRAALDLGYKLAVATPTPKAYHAYNVDYIIDTPVGDYEVAQRDILAYIDQHQLTIDGILVFKDREIVLSAMLCEKLGLPCSSVSAVENVRNKSNTRKVLDQLPGVNPRWAAVTDESTMLAAVEKVGFPCVLKQAGNSGSRGMRRLIDGDDAQAVYREFKQFNASQGGEMFHYYDDVALLEQEVSGTEHSIAGVVADGTVITLGIADKLFDNTLPLQYQNTVPSQLDSGLIDTIVDTVKKAVALTGINWSGFHADFMVTDEGIKILEIGGRLGGELINSHLIPLAQPGLKPYEVLIEVVQGRNPLSDTDYTRQFKGWATSRVVMPPSFGTISKISGIEAVRKDPRCREFMQLYGVGSKMFPPAQQFKAYEIGYIIAQGAKGSETQPAIDELINKITISMA
jgi:predicted ATP-grasp superfamily ATP-dependent carboligase